MEILILNFGAPGVIAANDGGKRLPIWRCPDPRLAPVRKASALQYFADSAFCRPHDLQLCGAQLDAQFSGSPVPVATRGDNRSDQFLAEFAGQKERSAATVAESGRAPRSHDGPATCRWSSVRCHKSRRAMKYSKNTLTVVVILNQLNA
ncbi:MAG: hypothetical protein JWP63_1925 [Candidatus Solibacter sp.]|nr:hypothetical protein [Candidatus Solibacter sp.]